MNPVQYIIINKAAKLSPGKLGAQAAHASQMGLLAQARAKGVSNPYDVGIVNRWMMSGHYAKIVLEVANERDFMAAHDYIRDRDVPVAEIIDEGRTEVDPFTRTALGTGVVDKDSGHIQGIFSQFKLYSDKDRDREVVEVASRAAVRATIDQMIDAGIVKRRYIERAREVQRNT